MQRRSFLRNAACVGACATLMAPLSEAWAGDADAAAEVAMRLVRMGDARSAAGGSALQVRAAPVQFVAPPSTLRVRAWMATEAGPRAFDLATFASSGSSQRLQFALEPQRLLGFEAATGRGFDDCASVAACANHDAIGGGLQPGRYRLWLSSAGRDIAAVDLEVASAAA